MNSRLPYHILNTAMIAGGVAFMIYLLNLVDFLTRFEVLHFLMLIGAAVFFKMIFGYFKPAIKDPILSNPLARRFFFGGMAILATALIMRTYHLPYYQILLYIDIVVQLVALGISFSVKTDVLNEEILDA